MDYAYRTDAGQQRENNQDFVGLFKNPAGATLAIVADGMGGHQGGDVASEMAVSHIGYAFEETNATDIYQGAKWLISELAKENERIRNRGQQFADLTGMGTTIVAVLFSEDRFLVANIGDSRAYLYRRNRLVQITEDHSLVNELVRSGELTLEEAENFPRKNVITRSLGVEPDVSADVQIYTMAPEDTLLLCSDGLTKTVSDDEIETILGGAPALDDEAQQLLDAANAAGSPDNVTALLIRACEGGGKHD